MMFSGLMLVANVAMVLVGTVVSVRVWQTR